MNNFEKIFDRGTILVNYGSVFFQGEVRMATVWAQSVWVLLLFRAENVRPYSSSSIILYFSVQIIWSLFLSIQNILFPIWSLSWSEIQSWKKEDWNMFNKRTYGKFCVWNFTHWEMVSSYVIHFSVENVPAD